MTLKIEKGIPVPTHNARFAKQYPFDQMEIGDSFLVPMPANKSPSSIYSALSQAKKRLKINLTSSRVEGGLRVWRIAEVGAEAKADASRRPGAQTGREVVHDLPEGGKPSPDARDCTCHPDDNPPKPCAQQFALTECRAVAVSRPNGESHGQ